MCIPPTLGGKIVHVLHLVWCLRGLYILTLLTLAFMYVLMQTFFELRSMIGDTVELQSYKFHFDDLDLHKKIIFDFVSVFYIAI